MGKQHRHKRERAGSSTTQKEEGEPRLSVPYLALPCLTLKKKGGERRRQHHPRGEKQHNTTAKEDGTATPTKAAPPTKGVSGTQHHTKGGEDEKQHRLPIGRGWGGGRGGGGRQHPSNLL